MALRGTFLLSALLLGLAACEDGLYGTDSGSLDQEASADFSYAVAASAASAFNLHNVTGEIQIVGVAGLDSIRVTGTRRVRAHTRSEADAALGLLEVTIQASEGVVGVETDFPSDTHDLSFIVDYECQVPDDLSVTVVNVTGTLICEDLRNGLHGSVITGDVHLSEVAGDILVRVVTGGVEGRVDVPAEGSCVVSVVTGGIDVQLLGFPSGSHCSMEVVTGTLRLSIPVAASAALSASVVTGSMSLQNLQLQNPTITRYSTTGRLGDGGATITLQVVTGSIYLVGVTNVPGG